MAMAKKTKTNIEFLLVKAELDGVPEKRLSRSRNIGQVDLVRPLTGKPVGSLTLVLRA